MFYSVKITRTRRIILLPNKIDILFYTFDLGIDLPTSNSQNNTTNWFSRKFLEKEVLNMFLELFVKNDMFRLLDLEIDLEDDLE